MQALRGVELSSDAGSGGVELSIDAGSEGCRAF